MQMHFGPFEEHQPDLPLFPTMRLPLASWQPGTVEVHESLAYTGVHKSSTAVLSGRSSAVAAAAHSLLAEMRPPPQEPLSIM